MCDEGFVLIGEPIIRCTEAGLWSHAPPFCKLEAFVRIDQPKHFLNLNGQHKKSADCTIYLYQIFFSTKLIFCHICFIAVVLLEQIVIFERLFCLCKSKTTNYKWGRDTFEMMQTYLCLCEFFYWRIWNQLKEKYKMKKCNYLYIKTSKSWPNINSSWKHLKLNNNRYRNT